MSRNIITQRALSVIFALCCYFFWWIGHPELISFQEQNQMFLFSADYFAERMCVAGGLSDYISEFLTQFYYYGSIGAAIIALILLFIQVLSHRILRLQLKGCEWSAFVFSFFPALLLWVHLMDENSLLSYPIAIVITLVAYLMGRRAGWLVQLLLSLPLYWLVGPAFLLQIGLSVIDNWKTSNQQAGISWRKALTQSLLMILSAITWLYVCRNFWMPQYPWKTVLAGINYYRLTRLTLEAPASQYGVLYTFFALLLFAKCFQCYRLRMQKNLVRNDLLTLLIFGIIYAGAVLAPAIARHPHDKNTHVILEQLYQMRRGDWNGIIAKAEEYKKEQLAALESPLSGNAVNLSLAMTRQLASRMFEFPQTGIQGLIMPRVRDNVSNVTSMEVFWQLGFINESLRYAFDSQESIANCRKSARFTRRMAECNILNGNYEVASKYIDLLKQTLFYDSWAEQAETYLYDEEKIKSNPEWNVKLQNRLSNDFLYYYPEMPKMLGQLVLHNRDNRLAFDYFMASLLLTGDARSFVANLPQQPREGQDPFPHGYQQYVEYMKTHANPADAVTGASY